MSILSAFLLGFSRVFLSVLSVRFIVAMILRLIVGVRNVKSVRDLIVLIIEG